MRKFFSPTITPTIIAVRDRLALFFNDAASLSTSIQSIEAQTEPTTSFRNTCGQSGEKEHARDRSPDEYEVFASTVQVGPFSGKIRTWEAAGRAYERLYCLCIEGDL